MASFKSLRRCVSLIAALCVVQTAEAGVIAAGTLNSCVNNGSTPETSLNCSKKLVVTLELANDKKYETEHMDFDISCVNSPTNQCPCPCDYTKDVGCTCRNLAQKLRVGLTKSAVYATYPLTYLQKFSGRPYEEVIVVSDNQCKDGDYDADSTCGWARAPDPIGNMQNVPSSQGFCCDCSALDKLGMSQITLQRGNIVCGSGLGAVAGLTQSSTSTSSAHCMRLDDNWWYLGYRVGSYQLDFQIGLNLTTTTAPLNSSFPLSNATSPGSVSFPTSQLLLLTPSQPLVINSERTLSAKLLGDLESYTQIPQLQGQYVFIPASKDRPGAANIQFNKDEWIVVDGSQVTLDGTECNKIGVGYPAFRNQSNRCNVPVLTCLASQIVDLQAADQTRISQGLDPLYLITRFGTGDDNPRQAEQTRTSTGMLLSLNLPITSIKTSLLTLTVAADNLTFTTNISPAKILSTQVCTFGGAICSGFQAMAGKGYLTASIQNVGFLPADYTVTVVGCSSGILPVVAQMASIPAQGTKDFIFELKMETDQAVPNASCTVVVQDTQGAVLGSSVVSFTVNATQYSPTPQQSDISDKVTGPGAAPTFNTCRQKCPNLFNLLCTVKTGCWTRLGAALVTMLTILSIMVGIYVAYKQGWLLRLILALGRRRKSRRATACEADGYGVGEGGCAKKKVLAAEGARGKGEEYSEESGATGALGGGMKALCSKWDMWGVTSGAGPLAISSTRSGIPAVPASLSANPLAALKSKQRAAGGYSYSLSNPSYQPDEGESEEEEVGAVHMPIRVQLSDPSRCGSGIAPGEESQMRSNPSIQGSPASEDPLLPLRAGNNSAAPSHAGGDAATWAGQQQRHQGRALHLSTAMSVLPLRAMSRYAEEPEPPAVPGPGEEEQLHEEWLQPHPSLSNSMHSVLQMQPLGRQATAPGHFTAHSPHFLGPAAGPLARRAPAFAACGAARSPGAPCTPPPSHPPQQHQQLHRPRAASAAAASAYADNSYQPSRQGTLQSSGTGPSPVTPFDAAGACTGDAADEGLLDDGNPSQNLTHTQVWNRLHGGCC